jgi:hypothetical protein
MNVQTVLLKLLVETFQLEESRIADFFTSHVSHFTNLHANHVDTASDWWFWNLFESFARYSTRCAQSEKQMGYFANLDLLVQALHLAVKSVLTYRILCLVFLANPCNARLNYCFWNARAKLHFGIPELISHQFAKEIKIACQSSLIIFWTTPLIKEPPCLITTASSACL